MSLLGVVYTVEQSDLGTTCGYCSSSGQRSAQASSFHDAELVTSYLKCEGYQAMIDRGWRRCGTLCYRPDMKRTCCPQYTIKLDALEFRASASQRKLLNRWNRFVLHGDASGDALGHKKGAKPKHAKKGAPEHSLIESIHAPEKHVLGEEHSAHEFEVTLEPSSYTLEKYQLFEAYQASIHKDSSYPSSFKRFLVETPLVTNPIPYGPTPPEHLPKAYGSYHQLYRLDGKLIAMSVLDILPSCVSSVYFVYDPAFDKHSLGKMSALREVSLAKEIHDAGVDDHRYLYLGYYVHTCPKMLYKGEYSPSYLLDPEEYTWHPLPECKKGLDKARYACFAHPEHSSQTPAPQRATIPEVPLSVLQSLHIIVDEDGESRIESFSNLQWSDEAEVKKSLSTLAYSLGFDLAKRMAYVINE
ncbi:arginine-tRNA-protein transferase [Thelephora terrestris]|uniref:Arginyl-tRNA--protein transferase 1 n=1 Tax=Thelephora terrestris TaxID=56493 RepID=A0A9P6HAK8_9AGAM|nr:arginine-tRNA-protein transferase [Thelephora terrestris]